VFQLFKPSQLFKRRISNSAGAFVDTGAHPEVVEVTVNANKRFQKIVGFGGAFTGSVDYNLDRLSDAMRQIVYL
jgi:O-glycosyl hydrolase